MGSANLVQQTFRFRDDDGSETGATFLGAGNGSDISRGTGTANRFRIRILVEETTDNKAASVAAGLRVSRNSGAYADIDNSSSLYVRAIASFNTSWTISDNDSTTEQLGWSSGVGASWTAGYMDVDGVDTATPSLKLDYTEFEFVIYIIDADVDNGDTLDFQIYNAGVALNSYTDTPRVTVVKAGGTTYYQDVNGAITPAGAASRVTSKVTDIIGAITPSGTVTRAMSKVTGIGGAIAPSGAVAKKAMATLLGTVTFGGIIIRKALKSLDGSIAPAGSVPAKAISKIFDIVGSISFSGFANGVLQGGTTFYQSVAGAIAPAGDIPAKAISIARLAGALSVAGAVVKKTASALAGVFASSGDVTKGASVAYSGELTPSGTIVGKAKKLLAGAATTAGAITQKNIFKALVGAIAPAGWVNGVLEGGTIFYQSIAGAIGLAGTIAGKAKKALAGEVAPNGTLVGMAKKLLIGTVDPEGTITRSISFNLPGMLTTSGIILKRASISLAGSATLAGTISSRIVDLTIKIVSSVLTFFKRGASESSGDRGADETFAHRSSDESSGGRGADETFAHGSSDESWG